MNCQIHSVLFPPFEPAFAVEQTFARRFTMLRALQDVTFTCEGSEAVITAYSSQWLRPEQRCSSEGAGRLIVSEITDHLSQAEISLCVFLRLARHSTFSTFALRRTRYRSSR